MSQNGAETPHGVLGSAKNNAKNRSALENAANQDRNCCSTQFFRSLLRINAIENASMEDFLIDFDRGCPAGCECGGLNYHIKDFCSVECLAEAAIQYDRESV